MGGIFGGGDDGGGLGDLSGLEQGVATYGGGVVGGIPGALAGRASAGGGGVNAISDRLAGMDPTRPITSDFQAAPISSGFQSSNPGMLYSPDFAQALRRSTYNSNLGFDDNGGTQPSFAQGLMGNYNQSQAQQQQLMNSLQGQAMGQGPGAQLSNNFLHQAQDTNAANAMGLMASQKGINPAMAARMAGQQSAMGNQQAAGQAANLNLQQALAAQSQLGGMLGQNQQNNANLFGNLTGQQNQQYGSIMSANQANNALGTGNDLEAQKLNQLTQSQNAANAMAAQGINAGVANNNVAARTKTQGGMMGGMGGLLSMGAGAMMAAAHGGESPGNVDVMLSPDEIRIPRDIASNREKAMEFIDNELGKVPGKAHFSGDDTRNDTYHTSVESGDVIVPRSSSNDKQKAIKFLDALKSGDGTWREKKK